MIYFNKHIYLQLENLFKTIKFKKEYEESIKESIRFFFLRKLKEDSSFIGEFHFNIINGSENINDIKEIKKELILKYEKEIMLCLNPNSYKEIKSDKRNLTEEENECICFLRWLKEKDMLKNNLIKSFLKEKEQKKYVSFFRIKANELNKKFYLDLKKVKEKEIKEVIENRKSLFLEKLKDDFTLDIMLFEEETEIKYDINMEFIYETKNDCKELDLKIINGEEIKEFNFKGENYKIINIKMFLNALKILSKKYKEGIEILNILLIK